MYEEKKTIHPSNNKSNETTSSLLFYQEILNVDSYLWHFLARFFRQHGRKKDVLFAQKGFLYFPLWMKIFNTYPKRYHNFNCSCIKMWRVISLFRVKKKYFVLFWKIFRIEQHCATYIFLQWNHKFILSRSC